jgi:hypothetical protein
MIGRALLEMVVQRDQTRPAAPITTSQGDPIKGIFSSPPPLSTAQQKLLALLDFPPFSFFLFQQSQQNDNRISLC